MRFQRVRGRSSFTDIELRPLNSAADIELRPLNSARSKFNGLDFCREYGIEGIGFPANMVWIFNGDYWKKMTIAQIDKWFNEGHAEQFFRSHPAFTARYVLGNILPNLRKVGTRGGHLPVRPRTSRNRLWGTNGVIDWSAQAGPIRVLATTSPSP
jgi:hypothetical protein